MDNINKLVSQLYIVKRLIYIYAIILAFILSSGSYYLISSSISNIIERYIKSHLEKNNSNIANNFNIIHFIIKFFIFFTLLKFIIKTILDLLFIDLDNPDCKLQSYIEKISKLTSVTFFIVYEIMLLPLNLINNLEQLFIVSEKFIINHFGIENGKNLEAVLKSDAEKLKKDFDCELYNYYQNLASSIDSWYIKLFLYIENKYLEKDNSNKNTNNIDKKNENIVNHVASSYAGYMSMKILIIGLIYIGLYFLFKDSPTLRFIIFIIIALLYVRHLIYSFGFKVATNQVEFIKSFTETFSKKSFNRTKKAYNIPNDLEKFSKDIKPLINPLMHLLFKQKKPSKLITDRHGHKDKC